LEEKKGIKNVEVMILWIQPIWLKKNPEFVLIIELKDMSSQNVQRLCPQSEVRDGFVKHVGQSMSDNAFVEQPQ
jgi:hypothetical protein